MKRTNKGSMTIVCYIIQEVITGGGGGGGGGGRGI